MIFLDLDPWGNGCFDGYVDGQPLVVRSKTPFFDAARALIAAGDSADETLAMRHKGSTVISLKSTLRTAAALRVEEGEGRPTFRRWRPFWQQGNGDAPTAA